MRHLDRQISNEKSRMRVLHTRPARRMMHLHVSSPQQLLDQVRASSPFLRTPVAEVQSLTATRPRFVGPIESRHVVCGVGPLGLLVSFAEAKEKRKIK
ncbi:hypothetical protein TIFTF001_003123 [Ficus carica]|uniref:Uncharacterized protein n=1 Tax=Ficus carica TaxID=3494 RepID=A0AA88CTK3_FICCA|nr:hypothetical protein TIFTF001_003123 [Ficus carica]